MLRTGATSIAHLTRSQGVVLFGFVLDAYSPRIAGWQFAPHIRTTLVHHGDAGSQYPQLRIHADAERSRRPVSIGTVGYAYDNAVAGSFGDS